MFSHSKKIELFTSKYKNNWYLFINFYFQFSGKEKKLSENRLICISARSIFNDSLKF